MAATPDIVTIGAGVALLLLAAIWKALAVNRRRRRVRARMQAAWADPDPSVRLAALQVAVQHGLLPVAAQLLDAIGSERDPMVLDGIAEAVARNQWEPIHDLKLLELRLWAQLRSVRRADAARAPTHESLSPHARARGELTVNGLGHKRGGDPSSALQRSLISASRWLRSGRADRPGPSGQA